MTIQLWKDRDKRLIDADLFSAFAEELAKKVNQERIQSRDKLNKPTQIRKFYDEMIRYRGVVQASPEEFVALLPYIKMLNAKAAYAMGRDLIGATFKSFISDSLKQVADSRDFELFCSFFEAFMGFYKYCAEKEGGGTEQLPTNDQRDQMRQFAPNQRQ